MVRRGVVALIFLLVSVAAGAMPPTPLPSVPLVAADGTKLQSDKLAIEGRWILVLVRSDSGAGGGMLDFLAGMQPTLDLSRLVIVTSGGDRSTLEALKVKRKPIETGKWYLDERDALSQGLALKTTPVVLGMQKGTAMWSVLGVPNGFQMDQMLKSWLGD